GSHYHTKSRNPNCTTSNNTNTHNFTGSVPVICASTCSVGNGVDPFAGDPAHTSQKCTGTGCRTSDTVTTCCVASGDTGGGVLMDVCSYPSQSPGSDPSDCINSPPTCT